jgi:hypothetical protein
VSLPSVQLAPFDLVAVLHRRLMDGLNNDGRAREDEMKIDDVELTLFSWDDARELLAPVRLVHRGVRYARSERG